MPGEQVVTFQAGSNAGYSSFSLGHLYRNVNHGAREPAGSVFIWLRCTVIGSNLITNHRIRLIIHSKRAKKAKSNPFKWSIQDHKWLKVRDISYGKLIKIFKWTLWLGFTCSICAIYEPGDRTIRRKILVLPCGRFGKHPTAAASRRKNLTKKMMDAIIQV